MQDIRSYMNNFTANTRPQYNTFVNALKAETNFKTTENGATALKSTMSNLYDLFALGGAYRSRSESDCILLFKKAFEENPEYAVKCLTYLRDIEEGQGERRFFRVCLQWLGNNYPDVVRHNMKKWVEDNYIRWDDLFMLFGTKVETEMKQLISNQLTADMKGAQKANGAVSLLAKWMPSNNASSANTCALADKFIKTFNCTPRQYRKMLSGLREHIHVVERLMSQNRWNEIDFSHLPSRAGLIYRKAFERREMIQEKYREFAESDTKVNAGKLYPYDVVREARNVGAISWREPALNDTQRLMVNKYWANLPNIFSENKNFNAMVVCDTSGSMTCGTKGNVAPIDVAVSLAIYAAEHANGPFKNHYISFSHRADLVEVNGVDFCDKVWRIIHTNLCENTNLESVFNLVLDTAMHNRLSQSAIPKTLIVISDMEVDVATNHYNESGNNFMVPFMETMRRKWKQKCDNKYEFPNLVFWNVNARNDTFLDDPKSGVTYVSGCSPTLFTQVMTGVTGEQLMMDKLNSERYNNITL